MTDVSGANPAADEHAMRIALDQAHNAWLVGEVPVGAVIMRAGQVIATGYNRPITEHDPTAHAEVADATQCPLDEVSDVHASLGQRLGLTRLRHQIDALPTDSYWQTLANVALGDDLAGLQRSIAHGVSHGQGIAAQMLAGWEQRNHDALERAQRLLSELGDAKGVDLAMLSVALRELRNLA